MTGDIQLRLKRHNNGEVSATKGRGPFVLVYSEKHIDRNSAAERERHLKSGQGREELDRIIASRS